MSRAARAAASRAEVPGAGRPTGHRHADAPHGSIVPPGRTASGDAPLCPGPATAVRTNGRPCVHVALVHAGVARAILDGRKTIESRFARDRRAPFGRVLAGDTIYFRVVGGTYAARCTVAAVESIEQATPADVAQVERRYRATIGGDRAFWQAARRARYVTLVHLLDPVGIDDGPTLHRKRGDRRAWFVLAWDHQ